MCRAKYGLGKGFRLWKIAQKCLQDYEQLQCHRAAASESCCMETDSSKSIRFEKINRAYLNVVMNSLRYLARQGVANTRHI